MVHTDLPFVLKRTFGFTASTIGLTLATLELGAITTSVLNKRFAQTLTNFQLIGVGFVSEGIALSLFWFTDELLFLIGALLIFGAGVGLIQPSADTGIS